MWAPLSSFCRSVAGMFKYRVKDVSVEPSAVKFDVGSILRSDCSSNSNIYVAVNYNCRNRRFVFTAVSEVARPKQRHFTFVYTWQINYELIWGGRI